jgi:flagellar biosynthetic protein FliO
VKDAGLWVFLAMSALVIVLAYASLRFLGNWQMRQTKGRRLRVLEGVPIGRDRHLLLVAVGKEVLVLGSSPGGVNLVHRVADAEGATLLAEQESPGMPGVAGRPLSQGGQMPTTPEAAIRASLGKIRSLLKKDHHDQTWGPL